ncbi:MAG TPA: DNA-binding protein WhiA [Candidatus Limnocylindrales bacterium]|nr:DNA-binding protein WhiA [Candidatus Limnocylindrales bacterium]
MSESDRDLVIALRGELARIDPARACDRRAETAGLSGGRTSGEGPVTRLIVRLRRERDRVATAEAEPATATEPATAIEPTPPAFDWDASAEHCRRAWLRGLFLARGSLSLAGGRTHLEFVVDPADAPVLAGRLAAAGLPASWRIRRRRGVVTWKNGDTIGLFLRRIGAGASLLELEARQVSRALRGDLNRVINAESANLQRSVGAAGRQVAAIEELTATGELARQPYVVRVVAEARRETPESTLSELAERLDMHRSAVQRALERLERLALLPPDDERRRAGGGRLGGALA